MPDKETRLQLFRGAQKIANETGAEILISEAPTDPAEKEEWVYHMVRIQIAFYVDEGAICAHCKHRYESVDDFLTRNPKGGYGDDKYVCNECWDAYIASKRRENMVEVKVTLSEEMVKFLEGIYETQQKLAVAAEHINAASEALSKLGLNQDDVASIVASRAGVSKTAVKKIFLVLRRKDLDAYEILAMFIAAKENIGRDQARRTLRCLMGLVLQVQGTETTKLITVTKGVEINGGI